MDLWVGVAHAIVAASVFVGLVLVWMFCRELLMKRFVKKELEQMSNSCQQFSETVKDFLLAHPKHEEFLVSGWGYSPVTVCGWAGGAAISYPPIHIRSSMTIFMREHIRCCSCGR